ADGPRCRRAATAAAGERPAPAAAGHCGRDYCRPKKLGHGAGADAVGAAADAVTALAATTGIRAACAALGVARARYYRQRASAAAPRPRGGGIQPRALSAEE